MVTKFYNLDKILVKNICERKFGQRQPDMHHTISNEAKLFLLSLHTAVTTAVFNFEDICKTLFQHSRYAIYIFEIKSTV